MVTADYSPMMSMHLWQKDMGIISQFVADSGAPSPVFDQARALYDLAYQAGYGDSDSSVIHRILKSMPHAPCVIQSHLGGLNASKLPSFPTEHLATNDLRRLDLSSLIP